MEIIVLSEGRGIERDVELFDGLYADDTILPSSERYHRRIGMRKKHRRRRWYISIDEVD